MTTTEPAATTLAATRAQLERNLARVRDRIRGACERVGREPDSVRLVAVTKYLQPWATALLARCGQTDLAENRVHRLADKKLHCESVLAQPVRWHMVGHVQRRKAAALLALEPALVHSVDSLRLLETLERRLAPGRRLSILLQVNVSGEPQKHGFAPAELDAAVAWLAPRTAFEVRGLMTMAPFGAPEVQLRAVFAGLRALRDRHRLTLPSLEELSMGMSGDLEAAIAEGATLVRVGSALCEGLPPVARLG